MNIGDKKMNKTNLITLKMMMITAIFFMSPLLFAKGDAAAGKKKSATCIACHGQKGISNNPLWPNLAGQKEKYLIKQLKDFKSGKRTDPSMSPMAKPLTDQDIENLAAYYSSLK